MQREASIIIVTFNRPSAVQRCLAQLTPQVFGSIEIVVVDASDNDLTQKVVESVPEARYVRAPHGYGHMTRSRNLGLQLTTGEIVIFIDDDAYACPGWLRNLLAPYSDPSVGAVGGRALNLVAGEESRGASEIGQLKSNGELTGNFAAMVSDVLEVDHIIGCNMSFRRSILQTLSGLREFPGTEVREETDTCLRVRKLGYRILFSPSACVEHVGAPHPHAVWKRFDIRYQFYAENNHILLLARNYGLLSKILWRYVFTSVAGSVSTLAWKIAAAIVHCFARIAGLSVGILHAGLDASMSKEDSLNREFKKLPKPESTHNLIH